MNRNSNKNPNKNMYKNTNRITPIAFLLLLSLISLPACADSSHDRHPSDTSVDVSLPTTQENSDSDASTAMRQTASEMDHALLYEKYVQVDELAPSNLTPNERYEFDDRTLVLEDSLNNPLEDLIFNYYYAQCAGDFAAVHNLIGENPSFQIVMKNEEKNFNEGIYMSEYVIHELNVLDAKELEQLDDFTTQLLKNTIETLELEQYALVRLDFDFTHNEAWMELAPQLDDGRYVWYYLAACTEDSEFQIYDVYWEESF